MSTEVDHAGTARSKDSYAMQQGFWASWRWQRSAQVHATLALVEQQRIANLLTIADLANANPRHQMAADARQALLVYKQHEDAEAGGWHEARPDIASALGLTAEQEGENDG